MKPHRLSPNDSGRQDPILAVNQAKLLTLLGARTDGGVHQPLTVPLLSQCWEVELLVAPVHLFRGPDVFWTVRSNENKSTGFSATTTRRARSRDPGILFGSSQLAVPRIRFARESAARSELPEYSSRERPPEKHLRNNHLDPGSEIAELYPRGTLPAFAAPSILPSDGL